MSPAIQEKCRVLVEQYVALLKKHNAMLKGKRIRKGLKAIDKQMVQVRNDLFTLMLPFLQRWVLSVMKKRGSYKAQDEILALCWDTFLFALTRYNVDKMNERHVPIPDHFNRYINFYIKGRMKEDTFLEGDKPSYGSVKGRKEIIQVEFGSLDCSSGIPNGLPDETIEESKIFSSIEFLREFREQLDESHRKIFDDAAMGTGSSGTRCGKGKRDALPFYRYDEAKRVYKNLIRFLLVGPFSGEK